MEGWSEFFLGELGAAAALAGLLVVAVTINIERIMSFPLLPGRAAQTIIIVGGALVISSFALFPRQPLWAFGLETVAVALVIAAAGGVQFRAAVQRRAAGDPLTWTLVPLLVDAMAALPLIIGGLLLIADADSGLYWIAVGVILSFVATLQNAWVLLIEILR